MFKFGATLGTVIDTKREPFGERRLTISYIGNPLREATIPAITYGGADEIGALTHPLVPPKGRRKQSIAVLRGPDVHLVAIQVCRAALFGAGIAATLACLSSTAPSPRQRLQCALSAAVCAISSVYYIQFYNIRKRPHLAGYTLAGNAAVDALRYASWSACITLLAWNALIFRGPFGKGQRWAGLTYNTWLVMGPLFACGSVLLGIPGWHSARSSSKDASCPRMIWLAIAAVLLLVAVAMSLSLAYTIQFAPLDTSVRSETEIQISRVMSAFWFVYPFVSCLRTLGMMIVSSRLGLLEKARTQFPRTTSAVCVLCNKLVFGIQKTFSTLTMAPMDVNEFNSITEFLECSDPTFACEAMLPSPVPVWVTQMCDFAISIVDIVTQVYSAVACVVYALPITPYL